MKEIKGNHSVVEQNFLNYLLYFCGGNRIKNDGSYPWGRCVPLHLFLWPQVFLDLGEKKNKRTRRDPRIQEKHLVGPTQSWLIAEAKSQSRDWHYRKGRQHQRMLEYPAAVPGHQHWEGWVSPEWVHQGEFVKPSNTRKQQGWTWKLTF